ncbi:MAG: hypothetical protein ACRC9G_08925, partial [Aeromonas veronii]
PGWFLLGIDKVGHRSVMSGVWFFSVVSGHRLAISRANQPLRAVNTQTKNSNIRWVRVAKWACQQEGIFT